MDREIALGNYIHETGLLRFGGIAWMCKLIPAKRMEILIDLYNRAVPTTVEVPLSEQDLKHIEMRKAGVRGVPIPERTRPSRASQCRELRALFQESGMTKEEFFALANEDNFDNMPMIVTHYLALYYDPKIARFSIEAFERQYNNGNGPA